MTLKMNFHMRLLVKDRIKKGNKKKCFFLLPIVKGAKDLQDYNED